MTTPHRPTVWCWQTTSTWTWTTRGTPRRLNRRAPLGNYWTDLGCAWRRRRDAPIRSGMGTD
eukprot:11202648-Lingulodinium_polyedra.AAC.1